MSETNECTQCSGHRRSIALVCFADGTSRMMQRECEICNGAGVISSEKAALIERGRSFHVDRVARRESLMDVAGRYGVSPAVVSGFERGMGDWEPPAAQDGGTE